VSDDDRPPVGFERFRRRATDLVGDRERLRALGAEALDRMEERAPRLGDAIGELRTLVRLIGAWSRAEYREVPRASLVLVAAAVLYFVVPLDVIPDFLFGVGLVDDIAVIGWVVRQVRRDLDAFRAWEARQDAMETMVGRSQVPTEKPPDP
jgi:uncharacterized membrane protein YkvA (DUF1232 family)